MNFRIPDNRPFFVFCRKYILNKYVLTLLIFGVLMVFVGNRSVINRIDRAHKIREREAVRDSFMLQTTVVREQLKQLSDSANIERFAREQYYMHTANEDVFLVNE